MTAKLEEVKCAVYKAVFDNLEEPDCLNLDDPARCRRFLADLREYLDRCVTEETDADFDPLNCAGIWSVISTAYDGKLNSDYGYKYAFDAMCDSLVESALAKYVAPQEGIDKVWFDDAFESEAQMFMDGGYFFDCD